LPVTPTPPELAAPIAGTNALAKSANATVVLTRFLIDWYFASPTG